MKVDMSEIKPGQVWKARPTARPTKGDLMSKSAKRYYHISILILSIGEDEIKFRRCCEDGSPMLRTNKRRGEKHYPESVMSKRTFRHRFKLIKDTN